ncbi:MAG: competence/damage-inducible protein A [Candidatus Lokiarchaeota archaeon]|nr:competence/damage-inducible protein A [Candidatus Lokiarchaeota archaeon]
MTSEIILVGNELLIGKIRDINGYWMIQRLLEYGHDVSRMILIPDEITVIAKTILESLFREPMFLFISGGLGPTHDDLTFEGIARALNLPLVLNSEALGFIKERYSKLGKEGITSTELYESRKKMALLPEGAIPLRNLNGTAPSIMIEAQNTNKTKIFAMPGVPSEFQSAFNHYVVPLLQHSDSHYLQAGFIFENVGESQIAAEIDTLQEEHPEIWIKTHPRIVVSLHEPIHKPICVELHLTSFINSPSLEDIDKRKRSILELRNKIKKIVENKGGLVRNEYD